MYPSGVFFTYFLMREAGYTYPVNIFRNYFYLNSTRNLSDYLLPVIFSGHITNLNYTNKNGEWTIPILYCSESLNNCWDLAQGGIFNVTYYFENIYSVPIDGTKLTYVNSHFGGGWINNHGIAIAGTEVTNFYTGWAQGTVPSLSPFAVANYSVLYDVNVSNNFAWMHTYGSNWISGPYSSGQAFYVMPGDTNISYFIFRNFDPRIQMKLIDGVYTPIFNLTNTFSTFDTMYGYENVFPGDYDLRYEVWNGTLDAGSVKDSYSVTGAQVFAQRGISNLSQGNSLQYNFEIPIKQEYITESAGGTKYYVRVYTIAKTGKFAGKKIATPPTAVDFTPGDIAYQLGNTLYFGLDSKIDSKKIVIFNPSFYPTTINLSIKNWSDWQNFTISWDGVNFGKRFENLINLGPLQFSEITFWVNATHNPWVTAPRLEDLKINIQADINNGATIVQKSSMFSYILNLSDRKINWFNLNPVGINPNSIEVEFGSSKIGLINVSWSIEGSDKEIDNQKNKHYDVNISIIDSSGNVLNHTTGDFIVPNKRGLESSRISYNFTPGNYRIKLELLPRPGLDESFIDGSDAMADNTRFYEFFASPNGCNYNSTNHYIYFAQYGLNIRQNNCDVNCCPIGTSCVAGFCADNFGNCSYNSLGQCNSMPWTHTAGDWCGWKCSSAFCPPPAEPGYENLGECLNCVTEIPNSCAGYNNKLTCNADPCYKKIYDCANFNCDTSLSYRCQWTNDKCVFNSTINGSVCIYAGEIVQDCNANSETKNRIIRYTDLYGNPGCPEKTFSSPCRDFVGLRFFSFWNLILAVTMITCYYFVRNRKSL